eukprot:TRINITY_DN15881_c0_g1_i1.p1 TRINITY_DN15881_c0_g1~~TRINITY_DN15881_c0_g1_i1.p1  ORF type:complete len:302 (+),score=69.38 TRINITY_DN15881_c0_g1_i1:110-907(+)
MNWIVTHCKKLKELNVSNLNLSDSELFSISKLENIHSLLMRNSMRVSDDGIIFISNCLKLKVLDISNCRKITDKSVLVLSEKLQKLKKISFQGVSKISDKSMIKLLHSNSGIKYVELGQCIKISDSTILSLSRLNLKYLDINGCRLITFFSVQKILQNCIFLSHFIYDNLSFDTSLITFYKSSLNSNLPSSNSSSINSLTSVPKQTTTEKRVFPNNLVKSTKSSKEKNSPTKVNQPKTNPNTFNQRNVKINLFPQIKDENTRNRN